MCLCKNRCGGKRSCICRRHDLSSCHPGKVCANKTSSITQKASDKDPEILSSDVSHENDSALLRPQEKKGILDGIWIGDETILNAQILMKKKFPYMEGLDDPLKGAFGGFDVMKERFVQVLHVNGNHWITVSNMASETAAQVCVYDSLRGTLSQKCKYDLAQMLHLPEIDELTVLVMNVQRQHGSDDCGLFALAFAFSLCEGEDPVALRYDHAEENEAPCALLRRKRNASISVKKNGSLTEETRRTSRGSRTTLRLQPTWRRNPHAFLRPLC